MPRSFPNMESLTSNAQLRNFRQPHDGESEADYRAALAQHVQDLGDIVEAMEIRSGQGWNAWDLNQTEALLTEASPEIGALLREAREERVATALEDLASSDPKQALAVLEKLLGPSRPPVKDDGFVVFESTTGKQHRVAAKDCTFRYVLLFDTLVIEQKAYVECFSQEIFERLSFPVSDPMFAGSAIVFSRQTTIDSNNCSESELLKAANKILGALRRQFARAIAVTIGTHNFVLKNASSMSDSAILDLLEESAEREAGQLATYRSRHTESFNPLEHTFEKLKNEELDQLFATIDPPRFESVYSIVDPMTHMTRWVPHNKNLAQYIFVFEEVGYFRAYPEIREAIDEHSFLLFDEGLQQRAFGRVLRYNRVLTRSMIDVWEETDKRIDTLRRWCDRRLFSPASFVMAEINGERFVIKNHAQLKPSHIRKTADYALTREACPILPLA